MSAGISSRKYAAGATVTFFIAFNVTLFAMNSCSLIFNYKRAELKNGSHNVLKVGWKMSGAFNNFVTVAHRHLSTLPFQVQLQEMILWDDIIAQIKYKLL